MVTVITITTVIITIAENIIMVEDTIVDMEDIKGNIVADTVEEVIINETRQVDRGRVMRQNIHY